MNVKQLYDNLAERKIKKSDFNDYNGNNGRVNKCAEFIKKGILNNFGTLLDVGGGIGDLGYSTRDIFDERWIIDISQANIEAAHSKGNKVVTANVDQDGLKYFDDDKFNCIVALDFIEHIIDPEFFAKECYRVAKKNATIFINTPNIEFFEHLSKLVINGEFPHTSGDKEVFHGGHVAFFTFNCLQIIFKKAGFENCEQIHDSENYKQPSSFWLGLRKPKNQIEFKIQCKRLGNPNLLFKCVKK